MLFLIRALWPSELFRRRYSILLRAVRHIQTVKERCAFQSHDTNDDFTPTSFSTSRPTPNRATKKTAPVTGQKKTSPILKMNRSVRTFWPPFFIKTAYNADKHASFYIFYIIVGLFLRSMIKARLLPSWEWRLFSVGYWTRPAPGRQACHQRGVEIAAGEPMASMVRCPVILWTSLWPGRSYSREKGLFWILPRSKLINRLKSGVAQRERGHGFQRERGHTTNRRKTTITEASSRKPLVVDKW